MSQGLFKLELRDYSPYFLERNPFPYTQVPEEKPVIYVDQEKVLGKLSDIISTVYSTGRSNHAVVVGPSGLGKSHTLKYIQKMIGEQIGGKALSCYISSPGQDFIHVYRSFIQRLGLEKMEAFAKADVEMSRNLRRALEALKEEKTAIAAWRWLLGEPLSSKELHRLGLSQNVDGPLSLNILQQTLSILRSSGYRFTCLLIDEMETINQLHIVRRQAMFNALRHLIDGNPYGLCFIFACTPAGWSEIFKYALALSRRISRNVLYLESMTKEQAGEFVAEYVRFHRKGTTKLRQALRLDRSLLDRVLGRRPKREAKALLALYPFTLDAISKIHELSKGSAGEVIKYCNLAIDYGLDNKRKLIDAKAIDDMVAELGG